eukprot:1831567-Pyramimonas_sp.AAC.1
MPSPHRRQGEELAEAYRDLHGVERVRDVATTEPRVATSLCPHARESAGAGELGAEGRTEAC